MLETLISQGTKSAPFFLLDFEDAAVGSQEFKVKSAVNYNFTRTTQGSPTDGVVDHPTYGKCYRLDGNAAFREPTQRLNLMNLDYFRMEVDFVADTQYVQLFLSGSQSSGRTGWNAYTTNGSRWIWAFLRGTNAEGGAYTGGAGNTPLNSLQKVSYTKDGGALTIKDELRDGSTTFGVNTNKVFPDSFFCIGCTESGFGGAMKGYIKRFQIFVQK